MEVMVMAEGWWLGSAAPEQGRVVCWLGVAELRIDGNLWSGSRYIAHCALCTLNSAALRAVKLPCFLSLLTM